jgi:iron complex outermembrane receptor protein
MHTSDDRHLTSRVLGSSQPPIDRKQDSGKASWRVALDHKLTDSVMVYASYNRGFKSGTFSTSVPTDPPVVQRSLTPMKSA